MSLLLSFGIAGVGIVVIGAPNDSVKVLTPFLNVDVVIAVVVVVVVGPLAVVLILHNTKDILRAIFVTPVKILPFF